MFNKLIKMINKDKSNGIVEENNIEKDLIINNEEKKSLKDIDIEKELYEILPEENKEEEEEEEIDSLLDFENFIKYLDIEDNKSKEKQETKNINIEIEKKEEKYIENIIIYGNENYLYNQTVFKILRDRFRDGTGGLWIANSEQFINVMGLITNDSEYFNYSERVFSVFKIEEEYIENIINKGYIYIVLVRNTLESDYTDFFDEYKIDKLLKIENKDKENFIPVIVSEDVKEERKITENIEEFYENNICLFLSASDLNNHKNESKQEFFGSYLILTNKIEKYKYKDYSSFLLTGNVNTDNRLLKDDELEKKVIVEIEKMNPMDSFLININKIEHFEN